MEELLEMYLDAEEGVPVYDLCFDYDLISPACECKFDALGGLELVPELEILSIAQHELATMHGLQELPKLRELNLSMNVIEEFSSLEGLPLEKIDLSHNSLYDVAGLTSLPLLIELNLAHNQLEEAWTGPELPALHTLILSGNRHLKQLDQLHKLPALETLYLKSCFISDYSGLKAAQQLRTLSISPGSMQGLEVLSELPDFQELLMSAKRLQGSASLPPMPRLTSLQISAGFGLKHIDGFAGLPQLESLILRRCKLKSPPDLSHCPGIRHLDLSYNPMPKLPDLEGLTDLETLILEGSPINPNAILAIQECFPKVDIRF